MPRYLNTSAVPLSLAVFLANDSYDHNDDPNTISATSLLKSIRQLVLSSRVKLDDAMVDLITMLPSRMGTAIHDAIERSWIHGYAKNLEILGYPRKIIDRIKINPTQAEVKADPDCIPIYLEQRASKKIGKFIVSGKYDFVGEGCLEDFKSTSTFTAVNNTNDEKYSWQGSIYRWLNPEIITANDMKIQFIFTDWSRMRALQDPKYPQQRTTQRLIPLKSLSETEQFIRSKLNQIETLWDAPEDQLPECTDDDLWRSEPVFKYYKNPAKMTRSTKNFDNQQDAYIRLKEDGNVGVVVEKPGEVTACKYCPAFSLCSQKDRLIAAGDLVL